MSKLQKIFGIFWITDHAKSFLTVNFSCFLYCQLEDNGLLLMVVQNMHFPHEKKGSTKPIFIIKN